MSLNQLQDERQALLRHSVKYPATTDQAALILEYKICVFDIQIECERKRVNLRLDYAMSRKRIVTEIDKLNSVKIEDYRSFFYREGPDKDYLNAINLKESKAITYYSQKINELQNELLSIRSAGAETAGQ